EVHQRRAQILTAVARLDEACAEGHKMLEYARAEGDRRLEAEAHADLAYAHYMALSWDHVDPLESHVREAYAIAQEVNDQRLIARTLYLMGAIDQMQARLGEAEGRFAESLQLARAGHHRDMVVQSETLLSLQRNWQGHFTESIAMCETVETSARELHD